ncbi:MAG: Trehalose/maltose import ATP-binding protein MalK [Methanoregula sp. PtaU1.Bin051]|nr:MAG: Trehalose/maltose import ATP-binding protein MalK [Methanoregula sp. PtaU1.Bin051]
MLEAELKKQLRDFSLELRIQVNCGKILALMGENGAGKSTVLNLLSGLLTPDTGSIRLNGRKLYDAASGISMPVESRRIGYVLQNSAAFPHLTAAGNIAYGMRAHHVPKARIPDLVNYWLDVMDIRSIAGVKASSLSGGQKQRVAIARALATGPDLLILDEPFTALDAESTAKVKRLLTAYVRDLRIPCIVVTHRITDIQDIGDTVCTLSRGGIVWQGRAGEIPDSAGNTEGSESRN